MRVRIKKALGLSMVSALATFAHAASNDANLPPLPEYYAEGVKPSTAERVDNALSWTNNFYISGKVGQSFLHVGDIENTSSGSNQATIASDTTSGTVTQWGVGLGYALKPSGIFSRIELEYMNKGNLDYNPNPVLNFIAEPPLPTVTLNSTIKVQTLLLKAYYDINFGSRLTPYIQAGGGVAFDTVDANGTFQDPLSTTPVSSNETNTTINFAWDAGVGLRFKFNPHLFADLGYEFEGLGKNLKWEIETTPDGSTAPITLESGNVYSNNITFALTLQI